MASALPASRGPAGHDGMVSAKPEEVPKPPPELAAHILDLIVPEKRESALLLLSKNRERYPDLAPYLWWSFGTMSVLLQEIVAIYPSLSPPMLTAPASNRVCNALALLQCVASHKLTRMRFLDARIVLYLYPFLSTSSEAKPFEYLRLTSLGVIGALVKHDDPKIVEFLIRTDIIPLSLGIMGEGTELSQTVAVFILEKIILDQNGLGHVCATPERFYAVEGILRKMVTSLEKTQSARLLKHVIRCYFRLSDHTRAREALQTCIPPSFSDGTFQPVLKADPSALLWLDKLLKAVLK